jgi:hypothetical protein
MADFIVNGVNAFMDSLRNLAKIPSKPPQAPAPSQLLRKAPIYLLVAWLGSFIFEGIYNISNNPLAPFPGPKLAAFTSWYKTYYEVFRRESWTEVLERLHKKYGLPRGTMSSRTSADSSRENCSGGPKRGMRLFASHSVFV